MTNTNTIKTYLLEQEAQGLLHIGDLAEFGLNMGVPNLIYNEDILNFFNQHEQAIEDVITGFVEETGGIETFDALADLEVFEALTELTNGLQFTSTDEMLEMQYMEAERIAKDDYADEWDEMDEGEQDDLITDYMADVETLPTDYDKINFVWLVVEMVAQDIMNERD